jgi:hypothetical protein
MAYDAADRVVVMFGGLALNGVHMNDTWTFAGGLWTQLHPSSSPGYREAGGMAYDAYAKTTVLFGGWSPAGPGPLNDTWIFAGGNWTQMHPARSPPARDYCTVAFNRPGNALLLFGGSTSVQPFNLQNDTWKWTGTNWMRV